jgi:hypothetical protein
MRWRDPDDHVLVAAVTLNWMYNLREKEEGGQAVSGSRRDVSLDCSRHLCTILCFQRFIHLAGLGRGAVSYQFVERGCRGA